jgi:hypothetical protein
MPNPPHELMHHIFRNDTGLFSRTLRLLEIDFPEHGAVTVGNGDATEVKVLSRAMDTLLEAQTEDGPVLIIIEAQNQPNPAKLRNWAYYPAYLHERRACPVVQIVVCRSESTAQWARKPYCIGLPATPTLTSTPIVFGPDNLPRITTEQEVRDDPNLAALCAIAFAYDADIAGILGVIASGLSSLDDQTTASNLFDFILRGLKSTPAELLWKDPMVIPTKLRLRSDLFLEGKDEGKVESKAEDVLKILDLRGIEVSPAHREQIASCTDLDVLNTWFAKAVTATSIADLTGLAA